MSEQHTQGNLTCTGYVIYADDGTPVANTGLCGSAYKNDLGNARRFTACWNACVGIPTHVLVDRKVSEALWLDLTAQRDELLDALQSIIADIDSPWGTDYDYNKARAAIAKATR